jgi:phospholipid/cholesterol/gamma-HCH transport system substrate-binding protein
MRDPGLRSQYKTEIQVGVLLILAFIALVLGVAWISGAKPGGVRLTFYAVAPDAAAVTQDTRISLLGVDVGEVNRVELRRDDVVLHMQIDHPGTIPRDTRGEIRASGFLGSMVVALLPGSSSASLADGDTIWASAALGLQSLTEELSDRASQVLERAQRLLSDDLIEDARGGTGSFSEAMAEIVALLQQERDVLRTLIEGLSETSANLADATSGPELDRTMANVDSLASRLAAASGDLDASSRSLASILDKVDRGDGTLGRLVNDPELFDRLTTATENIQAATEEIALLTKDVRERPERYLKDLKFSVF